MRQDAPHAFQVHGVTFADDPGRSDVSGCCDDARAQFSACCEDLGASFSAAGPAADHTASDPAVTVSLPAARSGLSRRGFIGWLGRVGVAALALPLVGRRAVAQAPRKIRLGFCGQLLCVIPYEVARHQGYFAEQGLDVELIYFRGGGPAMQACVGGAVDYAATSFDVALSAFARGARIQRFFTTGRLPLFALATAPKTAGDITTIAALRGRTVGISALGNADHVLLLYLLRRAGVRADTVQYAAIGANLFEALRIGHVDAGMVQEPAATLVLRAGGRMLANLMDLKEAQRFLGGAYEFMGVTLRRDEWNARVPEMRALARGLTRALRFIHYGTAPPLLDALPRELVAGGDRELFLQVMARHRRSFYPPDGRIQFDAVRRVAQMQRDAGLLPGTVDVRMLVTNAVVDSL